ncbi:hypothetical protein BA915_02140 [Helicobacter pullorum]|uniref:Uncharacterized protein n=2 Tax=Helicobacter pullorum TaxID=35818 RepID=A0A0N1MPE2_9HELI|nr:hypothetical protein [Helicobacter pullorum]EEQ62883.1 hypothetical protein HPMG_00340 [Helicobacter pullorum MIT 98-5489]KAB0575898.1 hypothetical protein F7P74_00785 [Helicobacter pullorum NCTC 12824]KPH51131.1 hypothetical protein HPU229336_08725 [Helicobacter pullorum]KPH53808.1 hypothetical protein HPU229254_09100 [Helicobacter pullorum]KPH54015.1 hypothetical protein HPU229313_07870 [Helicobacter pullorum]
MGSVGSFALVFGIIIAISLLIVLATIISVMRSGNKLTSFEKKILVFVAMALCFFVIVLYIASNFSLFLAWIS